MYIHALSRIYIHPHNSDPPSSSSYSRYTAEKDRFRVDAERKDEMTLTLNQSFQRQVQAAEQREQETKLQLEKEKDRYQQLITNLQTEIHEEVRLHVCVCVYL